MPENISGETGIPSDPSFGVDRGQAPRHYDANLGITGKTAPENRMVGSERFREAGNVGVGTDDEIDPQQEAMKAGFANDRLDYGHQNALRDREGWVMDHATSPQELITCLKPLRRLENWARTDAVNSYKFQGLIEGAFDNADSFGMTYADLTEEGVVVGGIDANGYIKPDGKLTEIGLAYVVKVEKDTVMQETIIPHIEFERDPETGARKNDKPTRIWDEVVKRPTIIEKPCFLSETQRIAMAVASEELGTQLLIGQKEHVETQVFDSQRAALEEQVKIFFFKKIGMGNQQFQEFFRAADIKKITPEKPRNQELGELRDRLMHVERLIGKCETKEKMEKALNETFILEQILDKKTVDTVLASLNIEMEQVNAAAGNPESDESFFERKYLKVAQTLIARDLEITSVDRTNRDGETVKVKQYELKGWLTATERDVCTDVWQPGGKDANGNGEHQRSGKKGKNAVEYEREKGVRGLLTNNGNIFTKGELDLQYSMNARMAHLFGDKKGYATRDADRFMWTRGEKDEMGAEIYAFKYGSDGKPLLDYDGNMIPNLPTGEDLVELWNSCKTEAEWKTKTGEEGFDILNRFSLPGEPVGSDLSKLIWAYLYALKDQINERPTGLLLGVDKMPKMSQSLLSIARTVTDTGFIDNVRHVTKSTSLRSLREQWDGYKGSDQLVIEPAKKLGEISWSQTKSVEDLDGELKKTLTSDLKGVLDAETSVKKKEITDAIFNIMNIDDTEKQKLIGISGSEEAALTTVIGKYFDVNQNGITASVDEFYKLFNFLAGDANPAKRPHAYFMDSKIDLKALADIDNWTGKKKFLQIIFTAAGAFGDFRKYDIRISKLTKMVPDEVSKLTIKDQKRLIKEDAEWNVSKVQKGWMAALRSSPMYPTLRSPIDYIKYEDNNMTDSNMTTVQIIEGLGKDRPGLAVRYGFMDPDEIGKPPKHQMKVLY